MTGKNRDPKVGIMVRDGLDKGARHVSLLLSEKSGLRLFSRLEDQGPTRVSENNEIRQTPVWVKIEREDNRFTGYVSREGKTWRQVGSPLSLEMPPRVYAGLAVTAGNRDGSRLHTATFSELRVTGDTVQAKRDVTFLHISDPHHSADAQGDLLAQTIEAMNEIPGTAYPAEIAGTVAGPRGVILTGDLTHSATPWQAGGTEDGRRRTDDGK